MSQRHLAETGRVLFQDILTAERQDGRRIIAENDSAIAFLPYFARYAGVDLKRVTCYILGAVESFLGPILGGVRDASGATLPGTTLTATNTETGLSRMTVSGEDGS